MQMCGNIATQAIAIITGKERGLPKCKKDKAREKSKFKESHEIAH